MRKVFFSLVATLAFGSFAMANNVELLPAEKLELTDVEITLVDTNEQKMVASSDCYNLYRDVKNCEITVNGTSPAEAERIARNAYYSCRQREALVEAGH